MRRVSTLSRVAERLTSSRPSVCVFCQHSSRRAAQFSTTTTKSARSSRRTEEDTPPPDFLERTRRRMWGTDAPPGPKDPYIRPTLISKAPPSALEEGEDGSTADDVRAYAAAEFAQQKIQLQQSVEDAPMHQDYIPATTWDGLEVVGGETEWDRGKRFEGFLPSTKYLEPPQITAAIYRSTIEVFAAFGAGRAPRVAKNYEVGTLLSAAANARLHYSPDNGQVSVTYPDADIEAAVLKAGSPSVILHLEELDAALDEEVVEVEANGVREMSKREEKELKAVMEIWGNEWREIPLEDQKVKFAVIKRLTCLLGRPVPDNVIHKSQKVGDLISQLAVARPPKTLYETMQQKQSLLEGVMNVEVQGRRRTPIDKEKELGRWKVIEQELRARDLSVVGRG